MVHLWKKYKKDKCPQPDTIQFKSWYMVSVFLPLQTNKLNPLKMIMFSPAFQNYLKILNNNFFSRPLVYLPRGLVTDDNVAFDRWGLGTNWLSSVTCLSSSVWLLWLEEDSSWIWLNQYLKYLLASHKAADHLLRERRLVTSNAEKNEPSKHEGQGGDQKPVEGSLDRHIPFPHSW